MFIQVDKNLFYFSFSMCQNVLLMRIRHSLATLLFFLSEVVPHFSNEILEKSWLWTCQLKPKFTRVRTEVITSSTCLSGELHCGSDWRRTGMWAAVSSLHPTGQEREGRNLREGGWLRLSSWRGHTEVGRQQLKSWIENWLTEYENSVTINERWGEE